LKTRGNADLRDVHASITMTAYLADQMRSFGQSDLARVYDLVVRELLERCETAVATNQTSVENRLH
jgi:DNA topoisomerase IA